MSDKYGYIGLETLLDFCSNQKDHCVTPNDFMRMNRVKIDERPHGEWIPCSERLPEKSGEYYVSGGDKVWICSFLIIPTFKGGWCNNVSNPVVEAWMPLPKPYKKEGDRSENMR